MITLAQLRIFAAVARHRHFTRTAEELRIAQPSVSYQVRALDRALALRLIELDGRRVYLTDAGERLSIRANALLNDLEDLEQEMRDYSAGIVGRLRLGATRTIGGYALPAVLAGFHAAHPRIELELTIDNTQAIEDMLLSRVIDLGIVEWRVTSPEIRSVSLRRDALVLVASPDHPLASRSTVHTEDALGPVASTFVRVLELAEPEAIVRAVEAGLGLAFISRVIVDRQLAAGTLRSITIEGVDLWRDFSLVWLRDRPESSAVRAFADYIHDAWSGGQEKRPASETPAS